MKLLLAVVILRRCQIDWRHIAKSRVVTAYVTSFLVTARIKELTAEQKPLTVRRRMRDRDWRFLTALQVSPGDLHPAYQTALCSNLAVLPVIRFNRPQTDAEPFRRSIASIRSS